MRKHESHLLTLAATACLAALVGCGKPVHPGDKPRAELPVVQVKAAPAQARSTESYQEVSGTVRAKLRATLEAKTSGRIVELAVEAGQRVKAGDLVAKLDAPEIKARMDMAEANLGQAEREFKRVSSLQQQQAATRAEFDSAESRLLAAKAGVAEAKAMLGYIQVQAPFDGVIARKLADVGDLAAPGKPLVMLEDPSKMQVEADIPEVIAGSISADMMMPVRIGQSKDPVSGKVAEISPVADAVSRTIKVKLDLPQDVRVASGQFARLQVPLGKEDSLFVPASAVVRRGQMDIVFVVEEGKARLHLVKTGRQQNDEIEILSGLTSGDKVLVEGANLVLDGQPVELK